MNTLKSLILLTALVIGAGAIVIATGAYNVGADDPHWPATHWVLTVARNRSVAVRASELVVPNLADPAMVSSGAGNYNAMCVGCHLRPGAAATELSSGLYPTPPSWQQLGAVDPRAAFWALKHGIKMSGMPAWGKSMDDQYLWGMVAFLQVLPTLDATRYEDLVRVSPGHHHGGGESDNHTSDVSSHADGDSGSPSRSSFEPVDDPMEPAASASGDSPAKPHDHH